MAENWATIVEVRADQARYFQQQVGAAVKIETHGAYPHLIVLKYKEPRSVEHLRNVAMSGISFIAMQRATATRCESIHVGHYDRGGREGASWASCDALDHLPAVIVGPDGNPDPDQLEAVRAVLAIIEKVEAEPEGFSAIDPDDASLTDIEDDVDDVDDDDAYDEELEQEEEDAREDLAASVGVPIAQVSAGNATQVIYRID